MKEKLTQNTSVDYILIHTFLPIIHVYLDRHYGEKVKERYTMAMKAHSLAIFCEIHHHKRSSPFTIFTKVIYG